MTAGRPSLRDTSSPVPRSPDLFEHACSTVSTSGCKVTEFDGSGAAVLTASEEGKSETES